MKRISLLSAVLMCVVSCTGDRLAGTEIGNPRSMTIKVVGATSANLPSKLTTRAQFGGDEIETARISLKEIEFVPGKNCSGNEESNEVALEGPFVTNLFTNVSTPAIPDSTIVQDYYCKISLKMAKLEAGDLPSGIDLSDPIVGYSARITGRTQGGIPFTILIDRDEEFEMENEVGFLLPTSSNTLLVAFNLDLWLEGVDFDSATVTLGEIVIDPSHNVDLFEIIKENIKASAELFGDQNDDGEIDDGDEPLAD